jgi:hypothetical protein
MERPQAFANLWLIFQILGIFISIGAPFIFYFCTWRELNAWRQIILIYLKYYYNLEHDPARPEIPESWEDWYRT